MKVTVFPEHIVDDDDEGEIEISGVKDAVTATFKVDGVLLPHELFALTEIVPPAEPDVTIIVFVVELPDDPFGKIQV